MAGPSAAVLDCPPGRGGKLLHLVAGRSAHFFLIKPFYGLALLKSRGTVLPVAKPGNGRLRNRRGLTHLHVVHPGLVDRL